MPGFITNQREIHASAGEVGFFYAYHHLIAEGVHLFRPLPHDSVVVLIELVEIIAEVLHPH
jgi:hypothetical protein